ncbi:putative isomerase YbhE [Astrocystis sublimbata]|nr:putative isomerase YbhE [Astrocystis sublimbata]
MILPTLTTLIALGTMAIAAPHTRRAADGVLTSFLIGSPGMLYTADLDGNELKITHNAGTPGELYSWMYYKRSTDTVYATDEWSGNISTFPLNGLNYPAHKSVEGSAGVVHLAMNGDETRMIGAGYGSGMIDAWDTSNPNDPLKLIKSINVTAAYPPKSGNMSKPHQAILDPKKEYFVVPDLEGDQLLIVDPKDDKFGIGPPVSLAAGHGPRHGGFIVSDDGTRTFFVLACEKSSQVVLYEVKYTDTGMEFNYINEQSTYGASPDFKPAAGAAAGEVVVASNNRDVYISNRLSGQDSDFIAHFKFDLATTSLTFAESVSSGGLGPRSMSLSSGEGVLFVGNQNGTLGVAAFGRCKTSGKLGSSPFTSIENKDVTPDATAGGPAYVGIFPIG